MLRVIVSIIQNVWFWFWFGRRPLRFLRVCSLRCRWARAKRPKCQRPYAFVVVIEERPDWSSVVGGVGGIFEVNGEVDAVEVAVEQQRLIGVEGESSYDEAELRLCGLVGGCELLCDSAGDHFVGFSSRRGSDQRVEGENTALRRRYFWRKESLPASEE